MKSLYDDVSAQCSKLITTRYSTSFSLGIRTLHRSLHRDIYAIYGFVRLADEIVDSFHGYDRAGMAAKFRADALQAITDGISINPVLHSFQETVRRYGIDLNLIDTFLKSMEMDLVRTEHTAETFEQYVLGSAEVVGLMCLTVFVGGDRPLYNCLEPYAMKLGAAFQKVNFLRDIQADFSILGRTYFPGVDFSRFSEREKLAIELDIANDFREALHGIRMLPATSKGGVFLAYFYYLKLFRKIQKTRSEHLITSRIRVSNPSKLWFMFEALFRVRCNLLS